MYPTDPLFSAPSPDLIIPEKLRRLALLQAALEEIRQAQRSSWDARLHDAAAGFLGQGSDEIDCPEEPQEE